MIKLLPWSLNDFQDYSCKFNMHKYIRWKKTLVCVVIAPTSPKQDELDFHFLSYVKFTQKICCQGNVTTESRTFWQILNQIFRSKSVPPSVLGSNLKVISVTWNLYYIWKEVLNEGILNVCASEFKHNDWYIFILYDFILMLKSLRLHLSLCLCAFF